MGQPADLAFLFRWGQAGWWNVLRSPLTTGDERAAPVMSGEDIPRAFLSLRQAHMGRGGGENLLVVDVYLLPRKDIGRSGHQQRAFNIRAGRSTAKGLHGITRSKGNPSPTA